MALFDPIRMGAAGAGGDYEIERSLRFNNDDSAHLSRTLSSDGNRRLWTWSGWLKLGKMPDNQRLYFHKEHHQVTSAIFNILVMVDSDLKVVVVKAMLLLKAFSEIQQLGIIL